MTSFDADAVASWLDANPGFFTKYVAQHADALLDVTVPNPHGGRAIALADRQLIALREKNRALETKLGELIQFGEENDAIGERVHALALALLPAADIDAALAAVYVSLREDFGVPHVAIRLWRGGGAQVEFAPVSAEMRDYAAQLEHAYCGPEQNFEATRWIGAAEPIGSVAFLPLREGRATFGLIALAAADAQRFYPEMGTVFLERIAALVAAALARFV